MLLHRQTSRSRKIPYHVTRAFADDSVRAHTGYSSGVAFAAAFKREHGITPSRYRASHEQPRDRQVRRGV
ncbi:hypothetical protein [Nonomuraea sp. NPDC049784]|uniref:hypothetical protein n=1 Tax=Nonomuraea sp. NPDC049784 TaxID=3154361 RepID=UPI003404D200